ncbi:MAG: hypothetical protein U9Q83_06810 [Bacteroidota bacterium]|nr:hypothetical protein [Bacteroidota bacterium]
MDEKNSHIFTSTTGTKERKGVTKGKNMGWYAFLFLVFIFSYSFFAFMFFK